MGLGFKGAGSGLMLHSLIPILGGGGGISGDYFIHLYGNGSNNAAKGCTLDSAGNLIVVGTGAGAIIGTVDGWAAKFDPDGVLLWAVAIGQASLTFFPQDVVVDGDDDIFVAGFGLNATYGSGDAGVCKLSGADGSMLARRQFGTASFDTLYKMAIDPSGNVFVGAGPTTGVTLLKWDNDLTPQWKRSLSTTGTLYPVGVTADSAGNGYLCFDRSGAHIAKWNSSGTIQWQGNVVGPDFACAFAVDSSDNLLLLTRDTTGTDTINVTKLSTVPAVTWCRNLEVSGTVALDSAGLFVGADNAVYVADKYNSSPARGLVAKWNSGGVIQGQAIIKADAGGGATMFQSVVVDAAGVITVVGETAAEGAGGIDGLIARIPADFSATGTYGNLDYETSAYTESAGGFTLSATSFTEAASSMSEGAGSLAVAPLTGFTLEEFILS